MRWRGAAVGSAVMLVCGTACGSGGDTVDDVPVAGEQQIEVTSSAFDDGGAIPSRYTCDGGETSPPLAWTGVPSDADALAVVVDDPDAPGGTFVHWVVVNINADQRGVKAGEVPTGGDLVTNSSGDAEYAGMCPPKGEHTYRFTVYALSSPADVASGDDLSAALDAITSVSVAYGQLTGTYARS